MAVFAEEPVDEVPGEVAVEAQVVEDGGGAAEVFGGFVEFEVFHDEFEFGDVFGDGGMVLAHDVVFFAEVRGGGGGLRISDCQHGRSTMGNGRYFWR